MDRFKRTVSLIGKESFEKLQASSVAVFGAGGVGSYVIEALVRGGVGKIDIFDNDTVDITNINRQIIATSDTVSKPKAEVCVQRALSINPNIKAAAHCVFYSAQNSHLYNLSEYDYVVDAIDTVSSKIELILKANECNVPIISSMGTANKLDNTAFIISDIYKTEVCPLAKVLRKELKQRGIKKLNVLYSKEKPILSDTNQRVLASISYVPATAGLIIAGKVIQDLIK